MRSFVILVYSAFTLSLSLVLMALHYYLKPLILREPLEAPLWATIVIGVCLLVDIPLIFYF